MILAALLLAQAASQTAVDAERAFAADAQKDGQWTAFRRWAADDAIMFFPEPEKMQERLRDAPDPPRAVAWQPGASFVSCDGTVAANTGPWQQPNGSTGYFSTIWVKQPGGGWKWVVDGGDGLATPRAAPAAPPVKVASCTGAPDSEGRYVEGSSGGGTSADETLTWYWQVEADGARRFTVGLWNGAGHDRVIDDRIAAPPSPKPKPKPKPKP